MPPRNNPLRDRGPAVSVAVNAEKRRAKKPRDLFEFRPFAEYASLWEIALAGCAKMVEALELYFSVDMPGLDREQLSTLAKRLQTLAEREAK